MGWKISCGAPKKVNAGRRMNAGVITSFPCSVTSIPCHAPAGWRFTPNADRTTSGEAGSNPACRLVWQNVLSTLVGN